MGYQETGDDIPPWALRAVERAGRSGLLAALGAPFVRAASTSYVRLPWTTAHLSTMDTGRVVSRAVRTEGDQSVGAWQKWASLWPNAHIVTASWNALDELAGDDGRARLVAGYVTADEAIHVGVLPENKPFGTLPEEVGTATMAVRQGRHPSRFIMGVLSAAGRLEVPAGLEVLADDDGTPLLVPVTQLATAYPETPLG